MFAILLCACGPNVAVTSAGDTNGARTDDDDGDETFGPTATQPDPTDSTLTSADVTTGMPDTGAPVETSSSEDGGSNPFLIEPDGGSDECDLWIDDCPPGEKCMPWANDGGGSWNSTKCTPLARDPKSVGESCTVEDSGVSGIDDCGPRSMCWNVDPDTLMGECVAFCSGSDANPTCEDPCDMCPISGEGVLILCLPTCDPLVPTCDDNEGCYPISYAFICVPHADDGMGALGDVCEFVNVCDPGLYCASAETVPECEGASCCASFCDPLAAIPCAGMPDGVECIPWYEEGEGPPCVSSAVGACLLPE
jgi:hypothetical protein